MSLWWPRRSVAARDFVNARYALNGQATALASLVSVTRASKALFDNLAGSFSEFDANVLARSDRGAMASAAFTNKIRNPRAEGGTIGTIGSGGVMPTNWNAGNFGAGVSAALVGTGTLNGWAYVDYRIFGTNTVGFTRQYQFYPEANTYAGAVAGEAWGAMLGVQRISGDFSVSSGCTVTMQFLTAAQAGVAGGAFSVVNNWASSDIVTFKPKGVAPATSAYVRSVIEINNVANGASIDVTLRIYSPKLCKLALAGAGAGWVPSYPILPPVGVPGDSARLADDCRAASYAWHGGAGLGSAATELVSVNFSHVGDAIARPIFEHSDGTSSNLVRFYVNASDKPTLKIVTGGAELADLSLTGSITTGNKAYAVGYGPDGLYVTDGSETVTAAAVALPALTELRHGGSVNGLFFNDVIRMQHSCTAMSAAEAAIWASGVLDAQALVNEADTEAGAGTISNLDAQVAAIMDDALAAAGAEVLATAAGYIAYADDRLRGRAVPPEPGWVADRPIRASGLYRRQLTASGRVGVRND